MTRLPLVLLLAILALVTACKRRALVWQAERKAQVGGEFIRLYDDGFLRIVDGVVVMPTGYHFLVTQARPAP